ncbi:DUF167 domain-containing protein [candidate division TA06 bacterium]|nr:DUF167 domain-containing protein [candidate division TA06 bacterium]
MNEIKSSENEGFHYGKTKIEKGKSRKDGRRICCLCKDPPVEFRANRAMIHLLSQYFGISKSRITILSGKKSKQKIVEIKN